MVMTEHNTEQGILRAPHYKIGAAFEEHSNIFFAGTSPKTNESFFIILPPEGILMTFNEAAEYAKEFPKKHTMEGTVRLPFQTELSHLVTHRNKFNALTHTESSAHSSYWSSEKYGPFREDREQKIKIWTTNFAKEKRNAFDPALKFSTLLVWEP